MSRRRKPGISSSAASRPFVSDTSLEDAKAGKESISEYNADFCEISPKALRQCLGAVLNSWICIVGMIDFRLGEDGWLYEGDFYWRAFCDNKTNVLPELCVLAT